MSGAGARIYIDQCRWPALLVLWRYWPDRESAASAGAACTLYIDRINRDEKGRP
jgi:hypothetical protein